MATLDLLPPDPRQFWGRSSRRLWSLGLMITVMAMALLFGPPTYSQESKFGQIERLGGKVYGGTSISFSGRPITDDDLKSVIDLIRVKELGLDETHVTDAGLAHLKDLTDMQSLGLNYTQVTDAGLVYLKGMTKLERLSLDNTQVTDAGLVHLKGLTSLRRLNLAETRVTDEGLAELQDALPALRIRAPDAPNPNDSEDTDDAAAATTRFRAGMPLTFVTAALRKHGIRATEGFWGLGAGHPKRSRRTFHVYPKFKTDDVVTLDVSCDQERGIYLIDDIYWWVDFEHDAKRPKKTRKNDYRHVSTLDIEDLTSRPTTQKSR